MNGVKGGEVTRHFSVQALHFSSATCQDGQTIYGYVRYCDHMQICTQTDTDTCISCSQFGVRPLAVFNERT